MKDAILVTGGAGFIGSHVAEELLARGRDVVVYDSFVSGAREQVPAGARVIEGDIRDRAALGAAMEGAAAAVHLAALVSVPDSVRDPAATHDVNVTGTFNVFEACRAAGIRRVVYASSAAVYGNGPEMPKSESMRPAPASPYALSKALDEQYAAYYQAAGSLDPVGLRFFNVYGPRQRGSHPYASVIPRWVEAARAGKPLELYGDGTQTRDFIHVRDVARAVADAVTGALPEERVLNVASGTELSLGKLVSLIEDASRAPLAVERRGGRPGDIGRSVADVSRIARAYGFTAEVSFKDGIAELFA
jgi:UDP-glucose 4-epimerase